MTKALKFDGISEVLELDRRRNAFGPPSIALTEYKPWLLRVLRRHERKIDEQKPMHQNVADSNVPNFAIPYCEVLAIDTPAQK